MAYVYDPAGRFDELCNTAMVELERDRAGAPIRPTTPTSPTGRSSAPVSVENNGMGDMLRFDAERLRILIERHHLHTGSRAPPRSWTTGTRR